MLDPGSSGEEPDRTDLCAPEAGERQHHLVAADKAGELATSVHSIACARSEASSSASEHQPTVQVWRDPQRTSCSHLCSHNAFNTSAGRSQTRHPLLPAESPQKLFVFFSPILQIKRLTTFLFSPNAFPKPANGSRGDESQPLRGCRISG